jgi:uncharacterized protein YqfB (UPF0267 family)
MKIITFRKEFKELILSGKKTETRRINKYVKVGDILLAKIGRTGKAFVELEVTGFKRERLNKISMIGIFNEGCTSKDLKNSSAVDWFTNIWNSINNKKGLRFTDNPIVSVINFKLIKIR